MRIFLLFIILCSINSFAQVYKTVEGDTLESIIDKNLSSDLSEEEKDQAKRIIKRKNQHIRDWYNLDVGLEIDLSKINFNVKEVIYISDDPELYLDQALYRFSLKWKMGSLTYLEKYADFEVQSDSSQLFNWEGDFVYSFGKNKKYWRYEIGIASSIFSFFEEDYKWLRIYKESKKHHYFYYLKYKTLDQKFDTLDASQFKIQKNREFQYLGIGYQLNYYFIGNDSYFYTEFYTSASGSGDEVSEGQAYLFSLGNSYGVTKNWGIEPYLDYHFFDGPNTNSHFLHLGLKIKFGFNVL